MPQPGDPAVPRPSLDRVTDRLVAVADDLASRAARDQDGGLARFASEINQAIYELCAARNRLAELAGTASVPGHDGGQR